MISPFDKMFDYDRNGKLDAFERGCEYQFMEDMLENEKPRRHDYDDDFDDDDEFDTF